MRKTFVVGKLHRNAAQIVVLSSRDRSPARALASLLAARPRAARVH